jgi:hypothetical protein
MEVIYADFRNSVNHGAAVALATSDQAILCSISTLAMDLIARRRIDL